MKVLLLTFEENEEDILTRILSCIGNRTEILEYEDRGILQFEGLCIDKYKRNVVREENEIELTYTEFEILLLLAQNAGVVFSKEQIYDTVWKEPYFGDYNIVMSHIRNIREKIEDNPSKPIYIQTAWWFVLTVSSIRREGRSRRERLHRNHSLTYRCHIFLRAGMPV